MDNEKITEQEDTQLLTPEQRAQLFLDEYSELCDKHGMEFMPIPQFKHSHGGTFVITVSLEMRSKA